VNDAGAPDMWARFYAIETNQPIFSGRDGVIRPRLADIEIERRTGYSWVGDYAGSLLAREYPAWQARAGSRPSALRQAEGKGARVAVTIIGLTICVGSGLSHV
jgi:hypothetical protein